MTSQKKKRRRKESVREPPVAEEEALLKLLLAAAEVVAEAEAEDQLLLRVAALAPSLHHATGSAQRNIEQLCMHTAYFLFLPSDSFSLPSSFVYNDNRGQKREQALNSEESREVVYPQWMPSVLRHLQAS